MINYLKQKQIPYTCTTSKQKKDIGYQDGDTIPEAWFIREKYVLEDALKESKDRGITDCYYYPYVGGSLELSIQKEEQQDTVVQIKTKGIIQLEDKIALIIHHNYEKNMTTEEIKKVIKDYKFNLIIKKNQELKIHTQKFSERIHTFD